MSEAAADHPPAWSLVGCRWCEALFVLVTWTPVNLCKAPLFAAGCAVSLASPEVADDVASCHIVGSFSWEEFTTETDLHSCHWLVISVGWVFDQLGLRLVLMMKQCLAGILYIKVSFWSDYPPHLYARLSAGGSMLARSGGQGRGTECNVPAMGCMIKLSVNVADWNVAIIMLDARSLWTAQNELLVHAKWQQQHCWCKQETCLQIAVSWGMMLTD